MHGPAGRINRKVNKYLIHSRPLTLKRWILQKTFTPLSYALEDVTKGQIARRYFGPSLLHYIDSGVEGPSG